MRRSSQARTQDSLRILHVTPYSAEAWAYGGIARLAGTMTRGLARRGHHVTVCATDACDRATRLPPAVASIARYRPRAATHTADGVVLRIFPNVSNTLAYRFQGFLPLGFESFMRRHAGSFDVAHLHASRNLLGVIAAHHLRRHGVPYLLAPNGTAPRLERRLLLKRGFDAALGQRVLDHASRVLAVSPIEARQLRELGVADNAIAMVPNPIDLDEFTEPIGRGLFRQRFGLPSGPLVMFLGKITPRKRLDVLARAFANLRSADAMLVVAGNDMGGMIGARSLVSALGVERRTHFVGLLRGRERLEALADADVLVYPSQHEIFGLVPLEALLCGTPVIVADDSGCAEVVSTVGGGQSVPVGDAEALAHAIDRVLEARPVWHAQAAQAANRVRATYGGDRVCAELERLYGEMAA